MHDPISPGSHSSKLLIGCIHVFLLNDLTLYLTDVRYTNPLLAQVMSMPLMGNSVFFLCCSVLVKSEGVVGNLGHEKLPFVFTLADVQ